MKRFLFLSPLLFLIACVRVPGIANTSPDALAVQTALSADEAYAAALTAVADTGYSVMHSDASRRSFETEPLIRDDLAVSISAAVLGETRAVVVLQGRFSIVGVTNEGPIRQTGEHGCPLLRAWGELESVAARLDGEATPILLDTLAVPSGRGGAGSQAIRSPASPCSP